MRQQNGAAWALTPCCVRQPRAQTIQCGCLALGRGADRGYRAVRCSAWRGPAQAGCHPGHWLMLPTHSGVQDRYDEARVARLDPCPSIQPVRFTRETLIPAAITASSARYQPARYSRFDLSRTHVSLVMPTAIRFDRFHAYIMAWNAPARTVEARPLISVRYARRLLCVHSRILDHVQHNRLSGCQHCAARDAALRHRRKVVAGVSATRHHQP